MKIEFDEAYLMENMMGPNALMLLEELMVGVDVRPGMRVLDLGCGMGLTSMALAAKWGVQVFALDLWITAGENYRRFCEKGLDHSIIPIHGDILEMPFAEGYFDAIISVDSYNFFGRDARFMDEKLAPLVKPGGAIALAFTGLTEELHGHLPKEILASWSEEDMETMQTMAWWEGIIGGSKLITDLTFREMQCGDAAWADWLKSENPYAVNDRLSMEAGAGKYMNFIAVRARRRP